MYTRKPIAAVLASLALVAANPLAVLNPRGSPSTDGHYVIEKVIIDSAYLLHLNDKEAPQQLPEKFQVWVNSKADTAGNAALCSTEWDANTAGGSMQVLNLPCSDTNIKATLQRYTVKPNFGWELIVKTPQRLDGVWRQVNFEAGNAGWTQSAPGVLQFTGPLSFESKANPESSLFDNLAAIYPRSPTSSP